MDNESIVELLKEILEERPVDNEESTAISDDVLVDTAVDNDAMSCSLCVVLLKIPEPTVDKVEYMFMPVYIAESISDRVSRVFGAPPTTVITAALTAADKFTASALISLESETSTATRDS